MEVSNTHLYHYQLICDFLFSLYAQLSRALQKRTHTIEEHMSKFVEDAHVDWNDERVKDHLAAMQLIN